MVRELGALFGREKSQPTNVDSKIKSFIVIKFLLSYAEQHDSLCQFSSVAQSCPTLRPYGLQHIRPLCPSPIPGAYSNSCPLSWQYHPTISSSVIPFSSCLQSFQASGSFPMSQLFASGDQIIGTSTSVSVEYLGLISFRMDWLDILAVQGTLEVFSNTTVQKHQFFGTRLSL